MSQCAFCKEVGHTLSRCENERIPVLMDRLVNAANYSIVYQINPLYLARDLERLVVAERRMVSRKLGLGCGGNKADIIRVLYDEKKGDVETARAELVLDTVVAGLTDMYTRNYMLFEPCCQFERDLSEKVVREIALEREIDTCKFNIMCTMIDLNAAYRKTRGLEGTILDSTAAYKTARGEADKLRKVYDLVHHTWIQAKKQTADAENAMLRNMMDRPRVAQVRKAYADSKVAEARSHAEYEISYAAMVEADDRAMERYEIMDNAISAYHESYTALKLAAARHTEADAELEAVQSRRELGPIKFKIATEVNPDQVFEDTDCPVCLESTIPLVVAGCKHKICQSCLPILLTRVLKDHKKDKKITPCCPLCRKNITQLTFTDAATCQTISEEFCC